jgi:hypothetical protein
MSLASESTRHPKPAHRRLKPPTADEQRHAAMARVRLPDLRRRLAHAERVLRQVEDGGPEPLHYPGGPQGEDAPKMLLGQMYLMRRELHELEQALAVVDQPASPPARVHTPSVGLAPVRAPRRANGCSGRPAPTPARRRAGVDTGGSGDSDPPEPAPRSGGQR